MKKILAAAGIFLGMLGGMASGIKVQAAEEAEVTGLNQIMVAEKEVDMKAAPEADSETLMTYEKDALIFVVGETADGWYQVTYQDKEGYVEKRGLHAQEIDVEGLDAEMAVNEEEGKLVMETVERYRAQARRSKMWGGIIVALVLAIFGVGIFSAVRMKQEEAGTGKPRRQKIKIEDWNE